MSDPEHSSTEDRFLLLGLSCHLRILLVVHCERESHDGELLIRIISQPSRDPNAKNANT